jgi:hypothetical protein
MLKAGEMLSEAAKQPKRDLGVRITTCMGYTVARHNGWLLAMSRDAISCPLSKGVYGLEEEVEYYKEGCTCAGMYTELNEAGHEFAISADVPAKLRQAGRDLGGSQLPRSDG